MAGTRDYSDYEYFDRAMCQYMRDVIGNRTVIFISGMAKTGADNMILDWANARGYPVVPKPANWKRFKELGKVKIAGMVRNNEMAKLGSHLVVFYDGVSRGTKNMLDCAKKRGLEIHIHLVDIIPEEID